MSTPEAAVAVRSLYDRLGGRVGIAAIVDDIIAAHIANPLVGERFKAIQDIDHAKRMACDFFCMGAGGPQKYAGKDMRTAHEGMGVTEREFDAVVDDIVSVLRAHAIDDTTRREVLAILTGFKGEIVHQ